MKMKLGETIVLGLVVLTIIVLVWKNINDKSVKRNVAVLDIALQAGDGGASTAVSQTWSQPAGTTIQEIYIKCTDAITFLSGMAGYAVTVSAGAIVAADPEGLAADTSTSVALGKLVSPDVISTYATTNVKRDVSLTYTHTTAIATDGQLHVVIIYI